MRIFAAVVVVLVIVGGAVAVVRGIGGRSVHLVQPIAFNHAVHINEAEAQCSQCHTDAEIDVSPGLPGKAICLDCHDIDEEEGSHPQKDLLFSYEDSDRDIPWVRVAVTKPDVFFSHRRHVGVAKIDCLRCHSDQKVLTAPPSKLRQVMAMDDCIACHEENGASSDCLACHR